MHFADGFGRSRNSATDQGACRHRDELHAHGPSEEVAQVQGCDRQGATALAPLGQDGASCFAFVYEPQKRVS